MSTNEEKSLGDNAHHQIDICCETLCDKETVKGYITELEAEVERLKKYEKIVRHQWAERLAERGLSVYFICGEGGEKDEMGLPELISVCPSFGLDGFAYYKKHTEYSAPGY